MSETRVSSKQYFYAGHRVVFSLKVTVLKVNSDGTLLVKSVGRRRPHTINPSLFTHAQLLGGKELAEADDE